MKSFFLTTTRRVLFARSAFLLFMLYSAWLLATAGLRPLMLPDEGRYAGVAWEMLNSGNWLVPTLDGMPFFHKPPLFYWVTAVGMHLFGVNEWAARLASTSSAILSVAVLYAFLRRYLDKACASLCVIVLATQPFFYAGAQFANLDMLVASMITVTVVTGADAIFRIERGLPYRSRLALSYTFAALGTLAKGLIGFVLPGAILLAWLLVRRKSRLIPTLLSVPMIGLFLLLAAPWFLWMQKSFSGFWDYFFVYHHFRRFAETGFNNQQPFWFYIPVLLLCTLPWSFWLFRAGSALRTGDAAQSAVRSLMVIWALVIVIFFSLPKSKLVGYILPALPPFAALIADAIMQWMKNRSAKSENTAIAWVGANAVVAAVLCVGIIVGLARSDHTGIQQFTTMMGRVMSPNDQIVMLDRYAYDLPFYVKAGRAPWVVSNWRDPKIVKIDNWRKELYDAGQFSPKKMRETLIPQDDLMKRFCEQPETGYWIWGDGNSLTRYPFLARLPVYSNGKNLLWRLDAQTQRLITLCSGNSTHG